MSESTPQIEITKLSALTGFTASELRRIAKDGFIPTAKAGKYPLHGGITGAFRYLREKLTQSEQASIPDYPTIKSCSSATGIPEQTLKKAKRSGCDAFNASGRVSFGRFLKWVFVDTAGKDAGVDWVKERAKTQTLRERVKLGIEERRLIERAIVQEKMSIACSEWIRSRQMSKDARSLTVSAEHDVLVAMARTLYDQATEDGGKILRSLSSVFVDSNQPKL